MVASARVERGIARLVMLVASLLVVFPACGGKASADARPPSPDAASDGGGDPCYLRICGIYPGGNDPAIAGGAGGADRAEAGPPGAGGTLAGASGAPNQCAPDGAHCESGAECCSGGCEVQTCISYPIECWTIGHRCRASVECCSLECSDGICAAAGGGSAGAGGASSACDHDAQACGGDGG